MRPDSGPGLHHPTGADTMWNPLLETLPRPRLRELQLLKLKRILDWAYRHSRFYADKFDRAGVDPLRIRSLTDLRLIPMTEKAEWLKAQGRNPGDFSATSAVGEEEIVRYHQTSGTTGDPIRLAFSHRDWYCWQQCWGYGLSASRMTAWDRVLVCFPFNLFVGWWGGQDAARLLGCRVYSGGGMRTLERLQLVREHRITVLMASPSYLLRMARLAQDKLGWSARRSDVRKLICGAEPGASIPATRRSLEQAWGAEVFDHLGASEVGPWGYECSSHPGGVHICEGFFLMEHLAPESDEPAAPGELSRLVVTSLEKYAQPVIRWDLKDLVRLSPIPCPCGRTFGWVEGGILGRADDLLKIRGVLFSPRAVEEVVRTFEPIIDYRIEITRREAMDELTLRCETKALDPEGAEQLSNDLIAALRLKTRLRFGVKLCGAGTLPAGPIKTRRIIDLRPGGEDLA